MTKKADYIPGHWFLLNMNNLYFKKKKFYEKNKKNKIIKFLSIIKYREISSNELDPQDPNNINNNIDTTNNNSIRPPQIH